MARKKEFFMDYATHAFNRYASLGCPTKEEYEKRIREDVYRRLALMEPALIVSKANATVKAQTPLLDDIDAVQKVFETLDRENKPYISAAIRAVYFPRLPRNQIKGIWGARIQHYSMECPCHPSTVYRWLKSSRLLFAKYRGLYTGIDDETW